REPTGAPGEPHFLETRQLELDAAGQREPCIALLTLGSFDLRFDGCVDSRRRLRRACRRRAFRPRRLLDPGRRASATTGRGLARPAASLHTRCLTRHLARVLVIPNAAAARPARGAG